MPPARRRFSDVTLADAVEWAEQREAQQAAGVQTLERPEETPGPPTAPTPLEAGGFPEPETLATPEPTAHHPAAGVEGMDPEFQRRIDALIAASGGRIFIKSGYRTYEEQAALYEAAKREHPENPGKWAAPPGESNHNRGLAADLDGDLVLAANLAPQFGLVFPMEHEDWHIEPANLRTDPSTPPTAYTAPGIKDKPPLTDKRGAPVELMASIADAVLAAAVNQEIDFARPFAQGEKKDTSVKTPTGTPKPLEGEGFAPPEEETAGALKTSGGAEPDLSDMDAVIRQAMAVEGVTDEQAFATAKHRMMVESGGRNIQQQIVDVNSGGNEAFGPWQFVQSTFNRFAHPEYTDWHNPYHQAIAFFRAVKGGKYKGNFQHPELLSSGGWSP